jgi:porphobilinogen deaminase
LVARLDGSEIIKSEKQGNITDTESIGNSLAELLLERGADVILKELTN